MGFGRTLEARPETIGFGAFKENISGVSPTSGILKIYEREGANRYFHVANKWLQSKEGQTFLKAIRLMFFVIINYDIFKNKIKISNNIGFYC